MKEYNYPKETPSTGGNRSVRIRLVSDANIAVATATLPSGETKVADTNDVLALGVIPKGKTVYITVEVRNPAPEEDEISVAFDLDGTEFLHHSNKISVSAEVSLNIDLTFS